MLFLNPAQRTLTQINNQIIPRVGPRGPVGSRFRRPLASLNSLKDVHYTLSTPSVSEAVINATAAIVSFNVTLMVLNALLCSYKLLRPSISLLHLHDGGLLWSEFHQSVQTRRGTRERHHSFVSYISRLRIRACLRIYSKASEATRQIHLMFNLKRNLLLSLLWVSILFEWLRLLHSRYPQITLITHKKTNKQNL